MKTFINPQSINTIKNVIFSSASRGGLLVKKASPTILLGAGVAGVIGACILACSASRKVDDILNEAEEDIENAREIYNEYQDDHSKKQLTKVYLRRTGQLVKLYSPAICLGGISIISILASHGIMCKRNAAMIAAYKIIDTSFSDYRNRVISELGEEADKRFKYGIKDISVTETEINPETGRKNKKKTTKAVLDGSSGLGSDMPSMYARFFDEGSTQWMKTPEYNLTFLKCQQNFANDMLISRGHVFLNEVYDMLGIPRSQAGAIVGWCLNSKDSDHYIDFGIYNINREGNRDFVNGINNSILLDFNVDGIIYDII